MNKKILLRGPVLSQSGYGEQARFALRSLRSKEDLFDWVDPKKRDTSNRDYSWLKSMWLRVQISSGLNRTVAKLFSISASIRCDAQVERVEEAIYDELSALELTPPSNQEIQRIRNQISAGQIRRLSSNFGLAIQLAHSTALFSNWKYGFNLSKELRNVEPEMISQVVKKFFNHNNRTVASLIPVDSCNK